MNHAPTLRLVIRSVTGNDNHHLWNNNGTWWCHFTLRSVDGSVRRIRKSLKTHDAGRARLKRDNLLARINEASGRLVA